jgi:uncharacterized protein (DUF169 family)
MTTLKEFNTYGEDLQKLLLLRTYPMAVKMLRSEADIPKGAIRPKKDRGYHLAQCQAFALSRGQGATIAMLKEDNWCWGPLIAYGLVDPRLAEKYVEIKDDVEILPRLEYGKYIGIVSAPLETANFEPDIVVIYSNVAQLNKMLHALQWIGEGNVTSTFFPTGSCAFSVVPALFGQYYITIPDWGELGRGLTGEDEIIFSVPKDKVKGLVAQLKKLDELKLGYKNHPTLELTPDFARPQFYKNFYRECGLYADDVPTWGEDTAQDIRYLSES